MDGNYVGLLPDGQEELIVSITTITAAMRKKVFGYDAITGEVDVKRAEYRWYYLMPSGV